MVCKIVRGGRMNELANAVKDLILEYEKVRDSEWCMNPIGYALHQTWKKYDLKYKENKQK